MPYLIPLGNLLGMCMKKEKIKDNTKIYPIMYPIFHRIWSVSGTVHITIKPSIPHKIWIPRTIYNNLYFVIFQSMVWWATALAVISTLLTFYFYSHQIMVFSNSTSLYRQYQALHLSSLYRERTVSTHSLVGIIPFWNNCFYDFTYTIMF